MKKIILWGDGILAGPSGFGELLIAHHFLHHPRADVSVSAHGGEQASVDSLVKEAPFHVIGKAPDLVLFGFGYADVAAGRTGAETAKALGTAVSLTLQKTGARICLALLVPSLFPEEREREACRAANAGMRGLASERVTTLDLERPAEGFLAEHRAGSGEKRALHIDTQRLTVQGRLVFAHHCYPLVPWPEVSPDCQRR